MLVVRIGGGVFGRANMCYDLIVICYLLFVIFGGGVLGEQTCVTTLLLVVSC